MSCVCVCVCQLVEAKRAVGGLVEVSKGGVKLKLKDLGGGDLLGAEQRLGVIDRDRHVAIHLVAIDRQHNLAIARRKFPFCFVLTNNVS